jgi:hypothetical protein
MEIISSRDKEEQTDDGQKENELINQQIEEQVIQESLQFE